MVQVSLTNKVIKGSFWLFSVTVASRFLNFLKTLLLAKLLAPHDFGLIGATLLIMGIFETFTQTGTATLLVQKKGNIDEYMDTAWTINVVRGIVIFFSLFFGAPLAGIFFKNTAIIPFIRILAFSRLMIAFSSAKFVFVQREFQFRKKFIYELSANITDITLSVILAYYLRNASALVWGLFGANVVRFVLSHVFFPHFPRLKYDIKKIREFANYGRWIFWSSILFYVISNGDSIFVGKVLGLVALGFYQIAYRIASMPAFEVSRVINDVTFPAYAKLQDDSARLKQAYLKVFGVTTFLIFPLAMLIFLHIRDVVLFIMGNRWLPIVPVVQLLGIFGIARSLGTINGALFKSCGKPKYDTVSAFIKLICMAVLIYPLTIKWGIIGTALSTTLPIILSQSYSFAMTSRIVRIKPKEYFFLFLPPIVGVLFMFFVSCCFNLALPKNIFSACASAIFSIATYLFCFHVINKKIRKPNILTLIKQSLAYA